MILLTNYHHRQISIDQTEVIACGQFANGRFPGICNWEGLAFKVQTPFVGSLYTNIIKTIIIHLHVMKGLLLVNGIRVMVCYELLLEYLMK